MKNKEYKKVIIILLIAIVIYFILGNIINYLGMTIYSIDDDYILYSDGYLKPEVYIQNNAPLTLPYVNSLFYYAVILIPEENLCQDFKCVPSTIYDIKKINSGDRLKLNISLAPNGEKNFTFITYSYLNIFNTHNFYKTKEVSCSIKENASSILTYFCTDGVQ